MRHGLTPLLLSGFCLVWAPFANGAPKRPPRLMTQVRIPEVALEGPGGKKLREQIGRKVRGLHACYERVVKYLPTAAGVVHLSFVVQADGRVAKVLLFEKISKHLRSCLERRVAAWRFSPVPREVICGPVRILYETFGPNLMNHEERMKFKFEETGDVKVRLGTDVLPQRVVIAGQCTDADACRRAITSASPTPSRPQPVVTLRAQVPVVDGLDKPAAEGLRKALEGKVAALGRCVESWAGSPPAKVRKLMLHLYLEASGAPSIRKAESPDLSSATLSCVEEAMGRWRLPPQGRVLLVSPIVVDVAESTPPGPATRPGGR